MYVAKCAQEKNPFIGLFGRANDTHTLLARNVQPNFLNACSVLKTKVIQTSIGGSNLIGIYATMNSNGIVLSSVAEEEEIRELKKLGFNVLRCSDKRNAVGNNIAANDKGGIINKNIDAKERRKASDCLGVPLEKLSLAGYETVGSACVVTNRGFVAHNDASDDEIAELESIFKVRGVTGTVNMGSPFPSLGLIANSHGYVMGEKTSGFEIVRIEEGLLRGD